MSEINIPVHAVIVAAGKSTRMGGGINKVFLPLDGKPVLYYSLSVFASLSYVTDITVVVREEDVDRAKDVAASVKTDKPVNIVFGGKERIDSVANGVAKLSGGIVAIHDGARPLIEKSVTDEAVASAKEHGAAVAAVPVKDTVVRAGKDGMLDETLDRSVLFAVQTPQCFDTDKFKAALASALSSLQKSRFTDDTGVYRAAGYDVALSKGSFENIKITTPEDIAVAEAILKRRNEI